MTRKNLITLIVVLILVVVLPLLLYLVKQTQIFKPKAAVLNGKGVDFVNSQGSPLPNGQSGIPETTEGTVNLKIQYSP